jgi:plasmid stabilization system protein ParE
MKLVFDARALTDLEGIFDWIAREPSHGQDRARQTVQQH